MSAIPMSAKAAARRLGIYSFLARESPSSLPAQPGQSPLPFAGTSNPFAPSKSNPNARSWTAPKYSLRRQQALRQQAAALGLPSDILPPPFINPNSLPSSLLKLDQGRRILAPSVHVPESSVLKELGMEKRGPYSGRKGAAFKGKIWERKKAERVVHLAKLLGASDAKVQAWKKAQQDAKAKAKPSLPF
ncbi:hypothetical protein JCM11641_004724 [Rhodosporidiobolus odoratus]